MQEVTVKHCVAGATSKQGQVFNLTTQEGATVVSLVPETPGTKIYVRTVQGNHINSVMEDGEWVSKRPKQQEQEGTSKTKPKEYTSSKSSWKESLPPLTPEQVASLACQVVDAMNKSGLLLKLPEGIDATSVFNTLFICASRPIQPHSPALEVISLDEYLAKQISQLDNI